MTDNDDYLWHRRYDVKVRTLMNRMYYQERQHIFEFREGIIKALSIAAGSIALAKVTEPEVIQLCAAIITIASTLSLVFSFGNKARDSVKRSTEWASLERDIDKVGERDFTEEQINQWFAQANEIESGEPAANKRLLNKCHDRAITALGGKLDVKLNLFDRYIPPIIIP
jgi:hypothetical protein